MAARHVKHPAASASAAAPRTTAHVRSIHVHAGPRSAGRRDLLRLTRVGRLRWGILSTADIARRKLVPGMQKADRCEVVAIASRDATRARRVADEMSIPKAHASYEALLDDPDVDAIYLPLPNDLHATWTIAAARAGKHVLCEKPLALSSADAQRMIDACGEAGVSLMEAFMYRLHP